MIVKITRVDLLLYAGLKKHVYTILYMYWCGAWWLSSRFRCLPPGESQVQIPL